MLCLVFYEKFSVVFYEKRIHFVSQYCSLVFDEQFSILVEYFMKTEFSM